MVSRKARNQSSKDNREQKSAEPEPPASAVKAGSEAEVKTVVPEVVEELSEDELKERHQLELKVERAFVEAGRALKLLRDKRLYRDRYKTFEEYCQHRFGFTRRHVNYLIAGSQVFDNLEMGTNSSQILPTSETQVRYLTKFEPDEQREIWQQAIETVGGGKVPTARVVKDIVESLKEKPLPQIPISYMRGDAFILQGLSGLERRYNGCWAIAREILEFSLIVETHDGKLQVKPDNLESIDDREVRRQIAALLKRIQKLRKFELDRGAIAVLEILGKQTFLTEVEEKLLQLLENYYGVR